MKGRLRILRQGRGLRDDKSCILLFAQLDVDVALLLLYEGQCYDFLAVADTQKDCLRGVDCDRSYGSTDLQVAYFGQRLGLESQKVASRGAYEDVAVIVGAVGHAGDLASRLEGLQHRLLLLDPIVEHKERLRLFWGRSFWFCVVSVLGHLGVAFVDQT